MSQNPPITNARLHGLDHLRALAIILVFLFHYRMFGHPAWVDNAGKFGWTGVDLFFVLSGYLIASQLFVQIVKTKTIDLGAFFTKRFFRILPPYLVVVTIYFLFPYVHEREALAPLWKYLTFTQNIGLDLRTQGTFSHAWSLCIEEQFYLLLPLTLLFLLYVKCLQKEYWLLILLFVAGFFIRALSYQALLQKDDSISGIEWYKHIYYPTWCRLDGLLIGAGIAAFLKFRPKSAARILNHGNYLLCLALILLVAAYWICFDEESFAATVFGFPLVSIGYGLLVLSAISPTGFLNRFHSIITSRIAAFSYVIYLTHKFIIHCTQEWTAKASIANDSIIALLLCITGIWFGAWLMHQLIEKPSFRWRNKVLNAINEKKSLQR